jgi:hypothetical protein
MNDDIFIVSDNKKEKAHIYILYIYIKTIHTVYWIKHRYIDVYIANEQDKT